MSDNTKFVKVTNRSGGAVCYRVPELNVTRMFHAHETKSVSVAELEAVAVQPGGRELLYNFLLIQDETALRETLNVQEAPEYWLAEENIPTWMNTCSLDEFKDGLDFAPEGVKELIKDYAISLPLNDMAKREAIREMLGFDITKAIELERLAKMDETGAEGNAEAAAGKRRSSASTINSMTNKNSADAGYKVISRG